MRAYRSDVETEQRQTAIGLNAFKQTTHLSRMSSTCIYSLSVGYPECLRTLNGWRLFTHPAIWKLGFSSASRPGQRYYLMGEELQLSLSSLSLNLRVFLRPGKRLLICVRPGLKTPQVVYPMQSLISQKIKLFKTSSSSSAPRKDPEEILVYTIYSMSK